MNVYESIEAWRQTRQALPHDATLGFVPTMGNLHQGHLELVKQSLHENTHTVVSLYVNRMQFNQAHDFENYPKTLEQDIKQLEALGASYCFVPTEAMMYPDGYQYQIHEIQDSLKMEGAKRPGHFTGVLTVVMKLFQIIKPTRAYFGEKDFQQLTLIQGMIDAFFLDIELRACPTIRNESGLALSSRNNHLSQTALKQAEQFAKLFHNATSCEEAITTLRAADIEVEYIEEHQYRRFAAVKIDGIRLIDNYSIMQ